MKKPKHVKGNLRRSRGIIIKVRARDNNGVVLHKGEFSISDEKNVERELITWKDSFGVPSRIFDKVAKQKYNLDDYEMIKEQMKKSIEESKEKIKKAFF